MSIASEYEQVAASFAGRQQALEEATLSPLAARSYPAHRVRAEEDCGLRTPFQRDRDRIVHCKAFRRLTHKTQVFVAPEGDHYRTRLTHTLEVTQVSRTVARALRLNEDLTEAIGLGHDLGHPPFGHIGEAVLDDCLRERFGRGFRHHEHSLRVVERLEREGAGLNLTEQVRDGILGHSGRAPLPATLEGRIVRLLDRVAYINHDIDDALRAGVLREGSLPAEPIATLGSTGRQRIDTLVHDVVEHSERAGDIVQGEQAGAAMTVLREFMFERVYLAPQAREEHAKIARAVRTLFDHYCEHPSEIPPYDAEADDDDVATRVMDYIAGMTDRFCIRQFQALTVPRAFPLVVSRYTPDSKERVRDAVDMVALVSARTDLRRAGPNSYEGLCPFHDERTPSFSVEPAQKVYYCFGCEAKGDAFTFVQETEGVDFKGALELLADRSGVELELEAEDPRDAQRRQRRERLLELLGRTAGFYERHLWESTEAKHAREYLEGRGLGEEALRSFRVGYSPSAWDRVLVGSRRAGFSEQELYLTGLAQRSKQDGRLYDRFRGRIMFPLADIRGRVLGFGARAMRDEQGRPGADRRGDGRVPKYLNTSDNEVYHKGQHLYGADLARLHATRAGEVVLCEGYTDVIALHQAGMRNAVGLMGTALTAEQVGELARMASRVLLALDSDSAGQEAMLRASKLAAQRKLELRVVEMPAGTDPADLLQSGGVEAMNEAVRRSVPFVRFRVERVLAQGDYGSPEGRDRTIEELRPVLATLPPSAMRMELTRLISGRLELPESVIERELSSTEASGRGQGAADGGRPAPAATTTAARTAATTTTATAKRRGVSGTLGRREETERTFLVLCLASPQEGAQALGELDLEGHFTSDLLRRAAEHLRRGNLREPMSMPESAGSGAAGEDAHALDRELEGVLAELVVQAGREEGQPAMLQVQRLQLELARVDRQIQAARVEGSGDVSDLARRRGDVKREFDRAYEQALQETGE